MITRLLADGQSQVCPSAAPHPSHSTLPLCSSVHLLHAHAHDQLQRAARECGRCDIAEFPTVKQGSIRVLCAPLLGGEACDDVEARMRFEALSLVTAMLRVNPRERISAKDALAHAFVSGA